MSRLLVLTTTLLALFACAGCSHGAAGSAAPAQPDRSRGGAADVRVRFVTPEPAGPSHEGEARKWRELGDDDEAQRLRSYLDNEAARFALSLYGLAWKINPPTGLDEPTLFIGIEPGGNFSRVGLTVVTGEEELAFPRLPYLILAAKRESFETTLLHETGHAVHALLAARGKQSLDRAGEDHTIAPIPHSTAAVTDRRTAFNEGFAIHLEAVNAHCGTAEGTRAYYQRRRRSYGPVPDLDAEYYSPIRDIMSYAQNFARYQHVRDGLYAFEAAPASSDYLRLQLDPARDLRALRSGSAMMANEGVVASVLFHLITADDCESLDALLPRYRPVLIALRSAEKNTGPLDAVPLIELVAALRATDPEGGKRAILAFLDITKGATMDADAGLVWAKLFDAALHLDRDGLKEVSFEIEGLRRSWEKDALTDVGALARALGPVVVLTAPTEKVGIALFGELQPLAFDINAVGPAVLALVPGIDAERANAIIVERRKRPFANAADFFDRVASLGLPEGVLVGEQ